jgi:hypothetical protein
MCEKRDDSQVGGEGGCSCLRRGRVVRCEKKEGVQVWKGKCSLGV